MEQNSKKRNSYVPLCAKAGFIPFITRDHNKNNVETPQCTL
jgi:hypothetical protein